MHTWTGAGGCTQQRTYSAGIPQQERNTENVEVPTGIKAKGGIRGKDEPGKTSGGSHDGGTYMARRKCHERHQLGVIGSGTRPKAVMPKKGNHHRAAQARDARPFKQSSERLARVVECYDEGSEVRAAGVPGSHV